MPVLSDRNATRSADCSVSACGVLGTRITQCLPSAPVTSAASNALPEAEPKRLAPAASSPSTAEVANAARVRWDLAIPDRVGRGPPPEAERHAVPSLLTRLACHARPDPFEASGVDAVAVAAGAA